MTILMTLKYKKNCMVRQWSSGVRDKKKSTVMHNNGINI